METAAISDVTPAMMDEAAHRAAEAFEAAADPSSIEAGHPDREPTNEQPAPHPTLNSGVIASVESLTGTPDAVLSVEAGVVEAVPVPVSPQVEAAAIPDLVDVAAASIEEAAPVIAFPAPLPHDNPLRLDLGSSGDAMGTYGVQVVEMLAANIAAGSQFLTALMGATSVTDVMAVNTRHLQRQMELLTTQRRQLTSLARTIALDAMKPFGTAPADRGRDRQRALLKR